MSDFLDQKRDEITARLKELQPLVDEFYRLQSAENALAGMDDGSTPEAPVPTPQATATGGASSASSSTPAPRRKRLPSKANPDGARRGRPKGSGKRAQQALELVRSRPGITIPELAEAMGIKQNYLYRVMPDLADQGMVSKSGRGWHVR